MAETRTCAQCGRPFMPRREHARFCCVPCRFAWNREHLGDPAPEASALQWSITAMGESIDRLARVKTLDQPRVFGMVAEAVWWVTLVDATLVRHHPDTYDHVLADHPQPQQRAIEDTLAGLRFVRNRMGRHADHVDLVQPRTGRFRLRDGIAAWIWKPVPEPDLTSLSPRGQTWEMSRYRAYRGLLADHGIMETFEQAAAFLKLTSATIGSPIKIPAPTTR